MKKRRLAIVAFLLIAVLTVAVGYAALNDTLYVSGTAKASSAEADEAFDVDVHFDAENAPTGEGYTVTIKEDDLGDVNDLAVVGVTGLINEGDDITIVIPIVNESQYDATLAVSVETFTSADGAFTFDYSVDPTIAAEGTANFTITVTLNKAPADADLTAGFSVDIDAVAVTN